jgi:predicted amino acid dehydrogenase
VYLSNSQPPWFAFLVHPRDVAEFVEMPGGTLIRRYSESDEDFIRKASTNPPVVVADVVFGGSPMRGEIVGVPRMPDAILTPDGNRAVVEAAQLAADRGARVVGLGALTAPATAGGRALLRHLPTNVTITNGNGLTAAVARENVLEASAAVGLGQHARVAVLGATGSVGHALAHLLADDGFTLTLVGPSIERVQRSFAGLLDRVRVASGPTAVAGAEVVAVLTNDPSARLTPELPDAGAIVIDFAQPHNVEDAQIGAFAARGIGVVRGGAVRIPGFASSRDFRLPSRRDCFACLAETYLLAKEGLREHSVGQPSADYARRMATLAARHGVRACPLSDQAAIAAATTKRPRIHALT